MDGFRHIVRHAYELDVRWLERRVRRGKAQRALRYVA